jgi:hypothetical protein
MKISRRHKINMGGILAALLAMRQTQPHVHTHFDCECSNESSSSSEEAERQVRKTTSWLERHRPEPKQSRTTSQATKGE